MLNREEKVLRQTFDLMESSSNDYDLVVDDDGVAMYSAPQPKEAPMASGQKSLESEAMNPFAVSGMPEERESYGEFTETLASGTAGAVGGAAAVTAGLPFDIVGLGKGIVDAIGAEEGQRFSSFLESFAEVSNSLGSGKTLEILQDQIESLPISDDLKTDMSEGSRLLGEWVELPIGIKALGRAVKALSKGQSESVAKRNVTKIIGKPENNQTETATKSEMGDS